MLAFLTKYVTKQRVERVYFLAKTEFKLRYYTNKLGLLWALFNPISQVLLYYFVFVYFLKVGTEDFIFYLFFGLITFVFFTQNSEGRIVFLNEKKIYYENTNMHKLELYISALISDFIGFSFNFSIAYIFYILFGTTYDIGVNILFFPLFLLLLFLISLAFALILSNLYIFFRDISQIWVVVSNIIFWTSPIIFTTDFLEGYPYIKCFHPLSTLVVFLRDIVMYDQMPNFFHLGLFSIVLIIYLSFGLYLLHRNGKWASEKFQ